MARLVHEKSSHFQRTPCMARDDQINPPRDYVNPETALGGADAVEKTTYAGNAHGTEPGAAPGQNVNVTAQVPHGGGTNVALWITAVIAILVAIVYGISLFR